MKSMHAVVRHIVFQSFKPWVAVLLLLPGATSASAATIVADGVRCTLVDAITAANTNAAAGGCRAGDNRNSGGDIIELTADVTLTSPNNQDASECPNGLPAVTSIIRIDGNRHTIARAGAVLDRPWFRILDSTAGSLTLRDVTVGNGFLEGFPQRCDGAGINGTVALINSTVSGNNIIEGNGGGINGTATLTNSTVSDNNTANGNGGGINGTATLFNSVVSGNCTGCQPSQARIKDDTARLATSLSGSMTNEGGGIAGRMTLVNSTVSGNFGYGGKQGAGGGLAIDGAATIVNSTISGNVGSSDIGVGGGIHLYRGTAILTNSTVSGNSASGSQTSISGSGGGIFSSGIFSSELGPGGTVTLVHSTVSGNSSSFPFPPAFGEAKGAGIFGDAVTLVDTIVAGNTASNPMDGDCFSTNMHFDGVNLIGDGSCDAASRGQLTGQPKLGPLADYGGPTPFQPLLPGSPAIDSIAFTPGAGCGPTKVASDQRGVPRPQPADGNCDIGAIEYTGFPTNPVLDNFNRADGNVGPNWSGDNDLASYRIVDRQVGVRNGGPVYWFPARFGRNQETYVTLTRIDNGGQHTLLLKVQGDSGDSALGEIDVQGNSDNSTSGEIDAQGDSSDSTLGEIEVLYDARAHVVRVQTLLPGHSKRKKYRDIPVTFEDGDQFGARVYATGEVQIYRNNVLLAMVTLKNRDQRVFNRVGGRIGLRFDATPKALVDSFGGGSVIR